MNKFLSMTVVIPSIMYGAEGVKISRAAILAAADLGQISVRCSNEGFQVKGPEGVQVVERGDTDQTLRRINPHNLAAFMKVGKLRVSKANDGKYVLRSQVDGLGGGPIFGSIAYWATKTLCYGGLITTASVATASGIGIVAGAAGASAGVTATATAMGVATAKLGTAAAVASSTGVAMGGAAGVVGAGLGATAAASTATTLATTSVIVSTASTAGGFFGFIEGLSLAAGAAATLCPFLP
jgi:hypothetical protein